MRSFLAKYAPPLSTSQVEEIAQEHERLVAIELEASQAKVATSTKKQR